MNNGSKQKAGKLWGLNLDTSLYALHLSSVAGHIDTSLHMQCLQTKQVLYVPSIVSPITNGVTTTWQNKINTHTRNRPNCEELFTAGLWNFMWRKDPWEFPGVLPSMCYVSTPTNIYNIYQHCLSSTPVLCHYQTSKVMSSLLRMHFKKMTLQIYKIDLVPLYLHHQKYQLQQQQNKQKPNNYIKKRKTLNEPVLMNNWTLPARLTDVYVKTSSWLANASDLHKLVFHT